MVKRYAIVRNARTRREAEAYLPDNYKVIYEGEWDLYEHGEWSGIVAERPSPPRVPVFVIQGEDREGWTLDDYVIPRYASGLIQAEEIDLSHPVMKEIPQERVV